MAKRTNEHLKLSDALQEFISQNKLEAGLNNQNVKQIWQNLMGNGVNNYTTSVELKNKTLYVKLNSSVLRNELSYGKSKIIRLINEEIGEELINKIVLQ